MADQPNTIKPAADSAEKAFEAASNAAATTVRTATPAKRTPARRKASATKAKTAARTAARQNARTATRTAKAVRKSAKRTINKTVNKAAKAATTATRQGANTMNATVNTMTDTARKVAEQGKARLDTIVAEANTQGRAALERNSRIAREVADFSNGNVEALVESGRIAADGVQKIGRNTIEFGRQSVADATAVVKTYAGVKNASELMQLQGDFIRKSFDAIVAQTSKNTEAMIKLSGEAFQPISTRFALAAKKIKTAA